MNPIDVKFLLSIEIKSTEATDSAVQINSILNSLRQSSILNTAPAELLQKRIRLLELINKDYPNKVFDFENIYFSVPQTAVQGQEFTWSLIATRVSKTFVCSNVSGTKVLVNIKDHADPNTFVRFALIDLDKFMMVKADPDPFKSMAAGS